MTAYVSTCCGAPLDERLPVQADQICRQCGNSCYALEAGAWQAWKDMVALGQEIEGEPAVSKHRHNHVTRDIKPEGQCPGCDRYHASRRGAGEG